MREKLIEDMIKEVYGPRYGSKEIVNYPPSNEYITGNLISSDSNEPDPDELTSYTTTGNGENSEDDNEDVNNIVIPPRAKLDPRMKQKSMGISFTTNNKIPSFKICVTYGTYKNIKDTTEWNRIPHYFIKDIMMDKPKVSIDMGDNNDLCLNIKKTITGEHALIMITLINNIKIKPKESKESYSIFQPSIRIKFTGDTELGNMNGESDSESPDNLRFLYRHKRTRARGFMCSAIWKDVDYVEYINKDVIWPDGLCFKECIEFEKPDVRSEFVPLFASPSPIFEWNQDYGKPPEFSTQKLSEMWKPETIDTYLTPLVNAYENWIKSNYNTGKSDVDITTTGQLIEKEKTFLVRLKKGIELLKNDEDVRLSFCFANRVILLQGQWKSSDYIFTWKSFQLAFIIMNIESISHPESEFRDYLDLLWIPAGGGKTEAYLALMAFTISLRRIRARKLGEPGNGTAVITRYTLRLLTIQQFTRTLKMIMAAEYLRVFKNNDGTTGWKPENCGFKYDMLYGSMRFAVGLWTGNQVTPNSLKGDGAIKALTDNKNEIDGEPAQVIRCPVCKSWLAVPSSGLSSGETLFLILKCGTHELNDDILSRLPEDKRKNIQKCEIINYKDDSGYRILKIVTESNYKLSIKQIDEIGEAIEYVLDSKIMSFRASRPGYFGVIHKNTNRKKVVSDNFEIYCPNPDCQINNKNISYKEGIPLLNGMDNTFTFPDGCVPVDNNLPFIPGSGFPVTAYTVDEQIYNSRPSVLIGTVDKIARLAFVKEAGNIFGGQNILPPELIIQDELHLLNGPLGSMFGLYEVAVESLIKNTGVKPKYIASTATIKNAEYVSNLLFDRKLFQFPPDGMDIDDSFFIKYPESIRDSWDEEKPSKIYAGICSPGSGRFGPPIRVWARMLQTLNDNRSDRNIKYYWTLIGYFNSIRELAGNRSLYTADIGERLTQISEPARKLDPGKIIELSSRINSTEIPVLLDSLEKEGSNDKNVENNSDSIFATSIFGTGIDIPHLSLMIVNGQPKTTSQYIQATGRIGRQHGGLVITLLRADRPRDLSHYEMFMGYHNMIHYNVENSSVSPFSTGCLSRASGPVMVSFLRNMNNPSGEWNTTDNASLCKYVNGELYRDDNGQVYRDDNKYSDINKFLSYLQERIKNVSDVAYNVIDMKDVLNEYPDVKQWMGISKALALHDKQLVFNETIYKRNKDVEKNVVLGDPAHMYNHNLKVVYKNAPQSLRDIEETTDFEV